MKKAKKVLALVLVLALTVALSVAGTIAYLSDKDDQVNTFVIGNVEIDLYEDFGDNDEATLEKLMPVTYNEDGTRRADNCIEKEVYVTNTGSEDAFVRVHIAIPARLDNGNPEFNAGKNTLHFNYDADSIGTDKWDWSKTTGADYEGDWNYYETSITVPFVTVDAEGKEVVEEKAVDYNVYVVTHEKALVKGEATGDAMSQVYLDKGVTNEEITSIKTELGEKWYIYVAAEGTQKAGFNNAYEALNTTFGTPGEYAFDWAAVTTDGDVFKNVD